MNLFLSLRLRIFLQPGNLLQEPAQLLPIWIRGTLQIMSYVLCGVGVASTKAQAKPRTCPLHAGMDLDLWYFNLEIFVFPNII
jgi:hypothetical protein